MHPDPRGPPKVQSPPKGIDPLQGRAQIRSICRVWWREATFSVLVDFEFVMARTLLMRTEKLDFVLEVLGLQDFALRFCSGTLEWWTESPRR